MKSVPYSQLGRQRLLLGERFIQRYPHFWLVWEPGVFAVPRGSVSTSATAVPTKNAPATPAKGEPLCFVLEPKSDGAPTSIGRAEGNDLVLSDATVSRHHCELKHESTGWVIACHAEASSGLSVNERRVAPGSAASLVAGERITLGNIVLAFVSAWGMVRRLSDEHGRSG